MPVDDAPLLIDEDTGDSEFVDALREAGHDVERVVDVAELGPGVPDTAVREYARETDRIVVTHDKGFKRVPTDAHAGVCFVPDHHLSGYQLSRIVVEILRRYPDRDSLRGVVHATEAWLD